MRPSVRFIGLLFAALLAVVVFVSLLQRDKPAPPTAVPPAGSALLPGEPQSPAPEPMPSEPPVNGREGLNIKKEPVHPSLERFGVPMSAEAPTREGGGSGDSGAAIPGGSTTGSPEGRVPGQIAGEPQGPGPLTGPAGETGPISEPFNIDDPGLPPEITDPIVSGPPPEASDPGIDYPAPEASDPGISYPAPEDSDPGIDYPSPEDSLPDPATSPPS